jgi:alkanesulfonate monooxygenase SsuD/methylene tetrahydromethanopterin reductase-like flavin-dependent oxidoreductase (luciferase family)
VVELDPDESGRRLALGAFFRSEWPPEDLPEFARTVERLGFDQLWLAEDCFFAGGLTMAAVALAVTSRIEVGIGLLPTMARNPAIVAMEIAALTRLFPGRLTVTFGHGVESWMMQINARPADRIKALSETIQSVRDLLTGNVVSAEGAYVELSDVALDHQPSHSPRLLVGTAGRRGVELAAELVDGVLLPEGATPAAVRWVTGLMGGPVVKRYTATYVWASIDDDRELAERRLAPDLRQWHHKARYPELIDRSPIRSTGEAIPDESVSDVLSQMALVGDAQSCAAGVARFAQAGTDSVILRPLLAGGLEEIVRFGTEVIPVLARSVTHL